MSAANPNAAVPNNASLAYAVNEKDLKAEKKHLEHVKIDKAKPTTAGGIHLGPGEKQADFPPNEVGMRSAEAARREAAADSLRGATSGSLTNTAIGTQPSHSGEVSVQSSVVMDTTQETNLKAPAEIQSLLSRLSSTTAQIDEYSRRQTEAISKDANDRIQHIIAEAQIQQDLLLKDASARSLEIEGEYATKLKEFLQGLDASKAANLAALERDLNYRQEQLLNNAREEMDAIHGAATAAKIRAMNEANQTVSADVDRLTAQVKSLGEAEVERRMNSQSTTIITTKTSTEGHADSAAPAAVGDMDKTVVTTTSIKERQTIASEPHAPTRI